MGRKGSSCDARSPRASTVAWTWTHYANGKVARREADTRGTGHVDLWVYYDDGGNVARAEALLEGDLKLTQVFVDGQVAREEWRRHPGGELAIATHQDGKVVQREEDSTGRAASISCRCSIPVAGS